MDEFKRLCHDHRRTKQLFISRNELCPDLDFFYARAFCRGAINDRFLCRFDTIVASLKRASSIFGEGTTDEMMEINAR